MKTKWRLDPGQIEVVDDAVAEVLRTKTPAQRVEMITAAHRTAKLMLAAAVKRKHPDWDARAVAREVARRLIGGTG
ncbi:MAG: hypothetical protein ABIP55_10970 [Tepidisphaeraceae bacterium]